jgi:sugar phosphate isomerase/epimerase
MRILKLAVATEVFGLPLRESLLAAAEGGAQGVRFNARDELRPGDLTDTGRRQFLHLLGERDLSVASLTFPTRRALYDETQLEARLAALKSAIEFTRQLRSSVLTFRIGRLPADDSKEQAILFDLLVDLARHGNQFGVVPCITPLAEPIDRLATLLSGIKSGPLGIDLDPAAMAVAGDPAHEVYRRHHQIVGHVLGRDAVKDLDGSSSEVALGRGEVDWVELLPMLSEGEYRGWVTVTRTQGEDRAGDALRAIKYLSQVVFE